LGVVATGLFGSALGILALTQPASAQQDPAANPGQNQGQGQGQGQAQGQGQGQGGRRRGGGNGNGGGGNFDPAQFRQRMDERMKQSLGVSDEEWGVLQPKIEKVRAAQRQSGRGGTFFGGRRNGPGGATGAGGTGAAGGTAPDGAAGGTPAAGQDRQRGRGGPGGRGPGGTPDDSPVAVKTRELQQAVQANASPDEIKAKIAALRDAKAKAREQVTQAQAELREVLTAKQEATLIGMGVLE
jgi:hypothetical protein